MTSGGHLCSLDAQAIERTDVISPFRSERQMVLDLFAPGEFVEAIVDMTPSLAEELYLKGLDVKLGWVQCNNFTGIESPNKAPKTSEIHIYTTAILIDEVAN